MPLLSQLGILELTVGVLSGWAMVATIESPELLRRAGMRHLGRVRQAHLDLILQGVILVAVGLAVDPLPTWIGFLLVQGAFLAPLLLGVLAFDSELQKGSRPYRALNTAVLLGFTVAWVALAITALSR
jgi:hypothetical protein